LNSKQKIATGGLLGTFGGVEIVFSILFGAALFTNLFWTVCLLPAAVAAGFGVVLALFGLYERGQGL